MFTKSKRTPFEMIMTSEPAGMNCQRLETLIRQIGENVEGDNGFWQFTAHNNRLVCVADEEHDRMRVMVAVTEVDEMTSDQMQECIEANFDRTMDARYCLSDGTLWAAFMHPLESLSSNLFRCACRQVVEISANFGTSYSSNEVHLRG